MCVQAPVTAAAWIAHAAYEAAEGKRRANRLHATHLPVSSKGAAFAGLDPVLLDAADIVCSTDLEAIEDSIADDVLNSPGQFCQLGSSQNSCLCPSAC